jgi:hypothetical protein
MQLPANIGQLVASDLATFVSVSRRMAQDHGLRASQQASWRRCNRALETDAIAGHRSSDYAPKTPKDLSQFAEGQDPVPLLDLPRVAPDPLRDCLHLTVGEVGESAIDQAVLRNKQDVLEQRLLVARQENSISVEKNQHAHERRPLVAVMERVIVDQAVQEGCGTALSGVVLEYVPEACHWTVDSALQQIRIANAGWIYRIATCAEGIHKRVVDSVDIIDAQMIRRLVSPR